MPTFTYPGVYIEELSSGVHAITGVATSIAAFFGWAPQGPTTEAVFVESWSDYEAVFGGLDARSKMGYAVNQFFANGGQQAYIVRLVWDGSLLAAPGTNLTPAATAVATGAGYATTSINASQGAISATTPVIVSIGPKVLQTLSVGPANLPPLPLGGVLQFTATGKSSDGSSGILASPAWTSSNPGVLSIASTGTATALGAGKAVLTATSGLVSGTLTVTVSPATLTPINPIVIHPATPTLDDGQTLQLTVVGNYTDGTSRDLTSVAVWTPVVSPQLTLSATGLVTALATTGTQAVSASFAGASASDIVTVGPKVVTAITIHPDVSVIQPLQTIPYTANAIFSDGTSAASSPGAWSSSNTSVATFAGNVATGVAAGVTTISFTSGGLTASATLTVTNATLNSISVTPLHPSVAHGLTLQLTALGVYSDGSTANLTHSVDWTSGSGDATIHKDTGLVTGNAVNPAVTLTATWQGLAPTVNLAVTAPVLTSLALTPATVSLIGSGSTAPLKATGTFSDGTTQDLSSTATWISSAPSIATVSSTGMATAVASGGSLTLFANNPGVWGNSLRVAITPQTSDPSRFGLLVQQITRSGQLRTIESFVNLSVVATDPMYAVTVIDSDSKYVSFIDPATNAPVVPSAAPSPTPIATPVALSGGADGSVLVPASDQNFEIVLLQSTTTGGLALLDRVEIFNLLCVPEETHPPTIQKLQKYCTDKRGFYIVDAPQLSTTANLIQSGPVGSTPGPITGAAAANSAYYFPWVQAPDPLFGNRPTLYPPCGFVAGIYAATDATRGVWKAPAGIGAGLTGVSGLQYQLTDLENGQLNIQAINCLRQFKVYGDVVWGARTLQGNDQAGSEWKYVPIRRLALFLESSLYEGTQWVVFEPNDVPLWSQIRLNVGAFMQGLFLQGAFQGTTPHQAYFVKCDSENNPQASIDLGIVNILVGFAPLYPAEFVVIQIQQIAGQVA